MSNSGFPLDPRHGPDQLESLLLQFSRVDASKHPDGAVVGLRLDLDTSGGSGSHPRCLHAIARGQVLEHGSNRFFRRLAEGVFDLEDLAKRTDDLAIPFL